jgi:peptidoglycan hydrolase-like protein with peptidoglycan-binding domain
MMDREHRQTHCEPRQASSVGLLVKGGRVIAMASVLAVAPMVAGLPVVSSQSHPQAVASHVRRLGLAASSVVLQRALRVGADGAFGPKTVAAVKAVQRSAKMAQTGVVSGWTWVAIENRMPR